MSDNVMTDEQYNSQVKAVWRATIYLTILTVVEVSMALFMHGKVSTFVLNSLFVLMTLWKAYFIIGEFMHVKYESRALVMTLGLPLTFLVWAVIAFAHDGNAWLKAFIEVTTP